MILAGGIIQDCLALRPTKHDRARDAHRSPGTLAYLVSAEAKGSGRTMNLSSIFLVISRRDSIEVPQASASRRFRDKTASSGADPRASAAPRTARRGAVNSARRHWRV